MTSLSSVQLLLSLIRTHFSFIMNFDMSVHSRCFFNTLSVVTFWGVWNIRTVRLHSAQEIIFRQVFHWNIFSNVTTTLGHFMLGNSEVFLSVIFPIGQGKDRTILSWFFCLINFYIVRFLFCLGVFLCFFMSKGLNKSGMQPLKSE